MNGGNDSFAQYGLLEKGRHCLLGMGVDGACISAGETGKPPRQPGGGESGYREGGCSSADVAEQGRRLGEMTPPSPPCTSPLSSEPSTLFPPSSPCCDIYLSYSDNVRTREQILACTAWALQCPAWDLPRQSRGSANIWRIT